MTDENRPAHPKPAAGDDIAPAHKITRRRFTKAGALAPVVMTLASRPVWGQTCSFSGQLSGNDYATAAPQGVAYPPSYWTLAQNSNEWPEYSYTDKQNNTKTKRIQPNDKIDEVLPNVLDGYDTCGFFDIGDEDTTFEDLLKAGDGDLVAEATAALLNVLKGQYGYGMDGLFSFLCTAADHPGAVDVLSCINNRG